MPRAAGALSFLLLFPAGSVYYKSSQLCSMRILCLGKEGWAEPLCLRNDGCRTMGDMPAPFIKQQLPSLPQPRNLPGLPHKAGATAREHDLNELQAKMQDSSWPGENAGFLPVQEPALRPRERKHPGSVSSRIIHLLAPAELCCLSQGELLSCSRKPSRAWKSGCGRRSRAALSCRVLRISGIH